MESSSLRARLADGPWLFSAPLDLAAFLGSALLALSLLLVGHYLGVLHGDTPEWAWVPFVLLVDVAHVYSTAFRVYLDPDELKRRALLYTAVPICGFVIGIAIYSESSVIFWRLLAYFAVFHFVRQQYGWMSLYRSKAKQFDPLTKWIDSVAIYMATVYPLLYWHANLPRQFWWFLNDDFQSIPAVVGDIAAWVYWSAMAAYVIKSGRDWSRGAGNIGKDIVLLTTAVCWYVGIITFNSDYAFTVTNVIIHGVPYMVLVFWYMRRRQDRTAGVKRTRAQHLFIFVSTVWLLAYVEELIWDKAVWHERTWLFGGGIDVGDWAVVIVPLLAVPQLTHYILDGFIWRQRKHVGFSLS